MTACTENYDSPPPTPTKKNFSNLGPDDIVRLPALSLLHPRSFPQPVRTSALMSVDELLVPPSSSSVPYQQPSDSLDVLFPPAKFRRATPTDGWTQDNGPCLSRPAGLKGERYSEGTGSAFGPRSAASRRGGRAGSRRVARGGPLLMQLRSLGVRETMRSPRSVTNMPAGVC